MKKQILCMAFVAIGAAMFGCKKTEEKLEIHSHSPEEGGTYTSPMPVEVHIEGGELIIHDIEIKIFEKTNPSNIVFDYDNHVEVTSFEVNDQCIANVTSATTFTLQAHVGEDEHTADLAFDFTIQP